MPEYDIIFVLPYPFSDHPSFPEGVLYRCLSRKGFRVGVIETPDRRDKAAFSRLGKPRLFFAVIPGPVDSMILNYTSLRKRRIEDRYQYAGKAFFDGAPQSIGSKIRPDRTVIEFSQRIRQAFKEASILTGGVEASMRRFAHYDFQQDSIRRSILLDSRADLVVAGIGEKQMIQIAVRARDGMRLREMTFPGTVRVTGEAPGGDRWVRLPSFEEIEKDPALLLQSHLALARALSAAKGAFQAHGERFVVQEPMEAYSRRDLDAACNLGYPRAHPERKDFSPALRMNLFSVTSHRGCGGGCAFCTVGAHEGKHVVSRSVESILGEIAEFRNHSQWKGIVSDVGGASAEMYMSDCGETACLRPSCLHPRKCPRLKIGGAYLHLLRECRKIKGVRKVFVGSGLRHDLLIENPELLEGIMVGHSGRFLRIAPEHTEDQLLAVMRKPSFEILEEFVRLFDGINGRLSRKIQLEPYLIVGHPGETFEDVVSLKKKLGALGLSTSGVQVFTPSPGSLSTAMYVARCTPRGEEIPVEKSIRELSRRKAFLISN